MKKNGNRLGQRKVNQLARAGASKDGRPAVPKILSETRIEHHEGPLPSPGVLAQYESIEPGLANRIVCMAEREGEHRRCGEDALRNAHVQDVLAERRERKRGQIIGGVVVLAALGIAAIIAVHGHGAWSNATAGTVAGVPLVGLVIAFISGGAKKVDRDE